MDPQTASTEAGLGAGEAVLVRYWAAARAAVGLVEERIPTAGPVSAAGLRGLVGDRHPEAARVLAICSLLVDDQPLGVADASAFLIEPGQTVEFLPPSAGG